MEIFKKNTTIIGLVLGLLILGALVAIIKNTRTAKNFESEISSDQSLTNLEATTEITEPIVVLYTLQGFNPATTTIERGDTVVFQNNNNHSFWPASNDHPSHSMYSQFDARHPIIPGQNFSFTFEKRGEWAFPRYFLRGGTTPPFSISASLRRMIGT